MKSTRMKRHQEKLRAISKRNNRIFAVTTMVGLVCPATLGTVQALADETAPPPTEQQAPTANLVTEATNDTTNQTQPVTENVTQEQPTNETPSQTPVTPEPAQNEVTQPEATPIENTQETQASAPKTDNTVTAEIPATETTDEQTSAEEPAKIEVQSFEAEEASFNSLVSQIGTILDELNIEITITSHRDRHNELYGRWGTASDAGRDTPEKDQTFYDQWLPELQSLLNESNQLKADVEASQTEDIYTYYVIRNVVDDNGNIIDTLRWPETAIKDTFVEIKAVNWYGYFLVPGSPSEYPATQITQDETQEFVFTYMSASSEKYRDPAKDQQIEDWLTEIYDLYFELEPKAKGTKYEAQLKHLWEEADVVGVSQGMIMQSSGILAWYDYAYTNIPPILAEMKALADEINNQPSETVNYTIRCLDEFGSPIAGVSDITKTAKKGASVTEKAPKVEGYFIPISNQKEITQTIGNNTVFEFRYSNNLTTVDIELNVVGSNTAKVGESKTYQLEKIEYFNDGSKKTTTLDFPNEYGALISSDPSDVIKNGTITFGKAGKRTLKSESYGEASFVVTVTDNTTNPPVTVDDSKLTEAIKNGEEAIKSGQYESSKDLEDAISKGKEVLGNKDRTQSQVDEATNAITNATNALKKKDGSNSGNNGGNDNQGNNSGNQNGTDGTGSQSDGNGGTNNVSNSNNGSNKTTVTNVINKTTQANSSGKDNLPQAGEDVSSSTMLAIAGLTLAGFSTVGILKRRRKA